MRAGLRVPRARRAPGVQWERMELMTFSAREGSIEAIRQALQVLPHENVTIKFLLRATGIVSKSDVDLAVVGKAVSFGFNVRAADSVKCYADNIGAEFRLCKVKYELTDDVQTAMEELLETVEDEISIGLLEVGAVFSSGSGRIAGCIVTEGKVVKDCVIKVVRKGKIVFVGVLNSLRRLKEALKEGSVEAIRQALQVLPHDNVTMKFLMQATGNISKSDVDLAVASKAIAFGFNVRVAGSVKSNTDNFGTETRLYKVIYEVIDEMRTAVEGLSETVEGSIEAIIQELQVLPQDIGTMKLQATGNVSKSDVDLEATGSVKSFADNNGAESRLYKVIYGLIDDVRTGVQGLSETVEDQILICSVQLRAVFSSGSGRTAGCMVTERKVVIDCGIRVLRKGRTVLVGVKFLRRIKEARREGSIEDIRQYLQVLPHDNVTMKFLLRATGIFSKSDVDLAVVVGKAISFGFNVRAADSVKSYADSIGAEFRLYKFTYELAADVRTALEELLETVEDEISIGSVEVRAVFSSGSGRIAGCMVTEGKVVKDCGVKVARKGKTVFVGVFNSLRRFKEAVKEGSVEAIRQALQVLPQDNVTTKFLLQATGNISKGDVDLAVARKAIAFGFIVRSASSVKSNADSIGAVIRLYKVIDDVRTAVEGLLETVEGSVEDIRQELQVFPQDIVTMKLQASGNVGKSELDLAAAGSVKSFVDNNGAEIRLYKDIYGLIDDKRNGVQGLSKIVEDQILIRSVEIRAVFSSGSGPTSGCLATEGKVVLDCGIRVLRKVRTVLVGVKCLRRIKEAMREGSIEAIRQDLQVLPQDNVIMKFLMQASGNVSKSDVDLAVVGKAIAFGFNVRAGSSVKSNADNIGAVIRLYKVIHEVIDYVRTAVEGLLKTVEDQIPIGSAEVRAVFSSGCSRIAGCLVTVGKVVRDFGIPVLRKGKSVFVGVVNSLGRIKEVVSEVIDRLECGTGSDDDFIDWEAGDTLEAFNTVQKHQTLEEASMSVVAAPKLGIKR